MEINAQREMDNLIEKIKESSVKPTLFLHSCCAPCSSYVIEYLHNYFKITVFYYNPNIFPREEYLKRKDEEIRFLKEFKNEIAFIEGDYDYDYYTNKVKGFENEREGGHRCHICYKLRLLETAKKAKEMNFDYFATTLTVSPYKNTKIINETGSGLEEKFGIKYLASDFKKKNGYMRSIQLSKDYNLYRQNYCGCSYSLEELNNKNNDNIN